MSKSQVYKTTLRNCSRCLYSRRDTEKVSPRLWPPAGGYLCPECLVPAAIEALKKHKEEETTRKSGIPAPTAPTKLQPHIEEKKKLNSRERKALKKAGLPEVVVCPVCKDRITDPKSIKLGWCQKCEWFTMNAKIPRAEPDEV